jgi:hypothetical protein
MFDPAKDAAPVKPMPGSLYSSSNFKEGHCGATVVRNANGGAQAVLNKYVSALYSSFSCVSHAPHLTPQF